MKTLTIMQPTYLPWLGYFDLIDQSKVFVFLDSVQFEKRSWQQRNRIKTVNGELLLTVPVLSKGRFYQKITDVEIDQTSNFTEKHLKAIKYSYANTKYFSIYFPFLSQILRKKHTHLVDLNIELITWIINILDIKTTTIRSSSLDVLGRKAEMLENICVLLKSKYYLSPFGAKSYLTNHNIFHRKGIKLIFHDYIHPVYYQSYGDFIPYLSVIDLLFNEGDRSMSIIRSGRKI